MKAVNQAVQFPSNSDQSVIIIYPLIKTRVKGKQINVILDEFAGLSYATERVCAKLNLEMQKLLEEIVLERFGRITSEPIDSFSTITFQNGAKIEVNVVSEICDALPPVS